MPPEQSRNGGPGEIIMHPVVARIDINAPRAGWFCELVIVIYEGVERLNLVVPRQLLAVPAPAERADKGDRGSQQFGLDLHGFNARREGGDLCVNELKAGGQAAL